MVAKWSMELAQAIKFMHNLVPKIIHRDIKPSNVMLDQHLTVKLCDLGLCKTIDRSTTG